LSADAGPIPVMYVNAIGTRLWVGRLTPAIRAKLYILTVAVPSFQNLFSQQCIKFCIIHQ
jgi:hypothetical protein